MSLRSLMCAVAAVAAATVQCVAATSSGRTGSLRGYDSRLTAPAPAVVPGSPWPMPQVYQVTDAVLPVRYRAFQFNVVGYTCDVLDAAFDRYYKLMFLTPAAKAARDSTSGHAAKDARYVKADQEVTGLDVNVLNPCETYPSLYSDESYKISVAPGNATLTAPSVWGALRGLETFSQIVYEPQYESHNLYLVNETAIVDYPRFAHRGLLLDTSRHFIEVNIIMQILEAMAQNKLNVFHWHIVDDESFPYRSSAFPNLSKKGAYEPYTHVYDAEDIRDVIEFARLRGIRVVSEFDTPGHTQSWGKGIPGLLTPCYSSSGQIDGTFGPIDPTVNSTYTFIADLFKEVLARFPDNYIHLGGDEVSFSCWQSNPDVQKFMQQMKFGSDYSLLESYYVQNVLGIIKQLSANRSYIVWEEVFDNGNKIAPDTVVQVWRFDNPKEVLASVTKAGYRALLSSCWYLNYINYAQDWLPFYTCDPQNFDGTDQQKQLVVGGEACMWGEYVDGTNVVTRTWPRASLVAERLWSSANINDPVKATPRLETHRCRMLMRGLDVEPVNGPSFCRYEKQGVAPPA